MTMTRNSAFALTLAALAAAPVFGQDLPPQASPGGWRKFGERQADQANPPSRRSEDDSREQAGGPPPPPPARRFEAPETLTIPAGTWLTVRVDQALSSDHNQPGDAFTATLAKPLVVDGLVVARRGQTIAGRVADVKRGGRVKGTSSLAIEITEIGLVDGQQVTVQSQLIEHTGGTSVGRDATAIGTTTGLGAAIGAAAGGGFGAGMGAIAGAGASAIGVLVTRGHATVVYPESQLTFRITQPVTIHNRSGQAFHPARQEDFEPHLQTRQARPQPSLMAPPPYYGGYPYPYFYGPRVYYRGYYGRRW